MKAITNAKVLSKTHRLNEIIMFANGEFISGQ